VLLRFAFKPGELRDWLDAADVMERVHLCPGESRSSSIVSAGQESGDGTVRLKGRWRRCVVSPHLMLLSFKTIISEPQRRPKGKTYIPHPAHPLINRLGSDYLSSSADASLVSPTHNLYSHPRSRPRNQAQQEEARTHPHSVRVVCYELASSGTMLQFRDSVLLPHPPGLRAV
jgi:hypothetical protein